MVVATPLVARCSPAQQPRLEESLYVLIVIHQRHLGAPVYWLLAQHVTEASSCSNDVVGKRSVLLLTHALVMQYVDSCDDG